ncbi:MAG TPA: AAA family ATPase [Chloroflexia bacterium]|nr:AAA family ATPase [Chloroflexia bacterium]
MEAVIFAGLQASGKSTFYLERFFHTHVRVSLDMLKTRQREAVLLRTCIDMQQPFVVDNTNPTIAARAPYIALARAAGFRVTGYYFQSQPAACVARNSTRAPGAQVPALAIWGTAKKLQPASLDEGFDKLYTVRIAPEGGFVVEPAL